MSKEAYYPLLGTWGPEGPDHMAEQIREITGEYPGDGGGGGRTWKQRDGSLIAVVDMTDGHLRNALRMLHRAADRWSVQTVTSRRPMADECEADFAEFAGLLGGASPSDLIRASPYHRVAEPLLDEWAARGNAEDSWHPRTEAAG